MRQAGRWDPEFARLRGDLSFYEFSENVELAAKASLCPRRFGVDAIILFYDITTLTVSMGLPFTLQPSRGPVPDRPVRTLADVERLQATPEPSTFGHIRQLLEVVKKGIERRGTVIVFARRIRSRWRPCATSAPTRIDATLRFASEQPRVWEALLERLSTATIHFLGTLVRDGADVYQLFDSWAGMLNHEDYQRWAQAYHQRIFAGVTAVPRILFVKEGPYLDLMAASGADVISLGVRHDLAEACRQYPRLVFQGNVDEKLLRTGTPEQVAAATRQCVAAGGGQRHIVNLSHGCDKGMPLVNFEAFVRTGQGILAKKGG